MSAMIVRKRVYEIIETANPGDRSSRLVDLGILALILINVGALIFQSVPEFDGRYATMFQNLELVSLAIFSLEYGCRMWACVEAEGYNNTITGRIRFALTPMALVDLAAVLPSLLGLDARFVRILRLLKLSRYIRAMQVFQRVLIKKRMELMVTLIIILILLVFTSCLMYLAEREANSDQFGSIPAAMWWSIVTLTTVGYGDASPITPLGQAFAGLVAILGIGMFALPTSILGAAFLEEVDDQRISKARCPHCGKTP